MEWATPGQAASSPPTAPIVIRSRLAVACGPPTPAGHQPPVPGCSPGWVGGGALARGPSGGSPALPPKAQPRRQPRLCLGLRVAMNYFIIINLLCKSLGFYDDMPESDIHNSLHVV